TRKPAAFDCAVSMMRNGSQDVMFVSKAENISASGIFFSSRDIERIFGPEVQDEKNLVELAQKILSKMNTRVVIELKYEKVRSLIKDATITRFEISTGKTREIGLGCKFDKRLSFKEMALLGLLAS
ncbi:MAG TPA: hypothetical protein VJB14_01785, partial [Planctomycetota bacterium]|nr:hypothetical protein [Planctomycetota bacterium]